MNPHLKIEISSSHQAEGVPEVTLMIRWHRRLVHTDKALFGDGEIVLPHPEPTAFSFTTHHEELWRLVHAIRGREDEYDRALEQRRSEVEQWSCAPTRFVLAYLGQGTKINWDHGIPLP